MSNKLSAMPPHEMVASNKEFFQNALTDTRIKWEKEYQFATQYLQKNQFLFDTAVKNQASLQNAIINVAAIGITLNPAAKLAYLVPRDGQVCLDISYMGLLHLAIDSGAITWGQCRLVRQNDTYTNLGLDKMPEHKYNAFGDRGEVVGGFCTVKLPNGDYLTEEMSLYDITQVQSTSKAKNGPWKTFWDEMARKTIVKRASKYWPKVERLDNAIQYLNENNDEGLEEKDVTATEYQVNQIKAKCERLDISTAGVLRAAKTDKLEDLDQVIAGRYINRLNEWLGLLDTITEMRQAFEAEDYDYFFQLYIELDEVERQSLQVAPTKGGVLTVEQNKVLNEKWSEHMAELREMASNG